MASRRFGARRVNGGTTVSKKFHLQIHGGEIRSSCGTSTRCAGRSHRLPSPTRAIERWQPWNAFWALGSFSARRTSTICTSRPDPVRSTCKASCSRAVASAVECPSTTRIALYLRWPMQWLRVPPTMNVSLGIWSCREEWVLVLVLCVTRIMTAHQESTDVSSVASPSQLSAI